MSHRSQKKIYPSEATPDETAQIKQPNIQLPSPTICDGIFIIHTHIGYYSGLMYLGKEALVRKISLHIYYQNQNPLFNLKGHGIN